MSMIEMAQCGVCQQMCPKSETAFRIKENLVHELEKSNGKPEVLVKEYRRSAAGRGVSDVKQLRTRQALTTTTDYLINEVCSREDVDWALIYEFVFDRLRAVRQDLTIQSISDKTTVNILESCVRFYFISVSKLNGRSTNIFDPKINSTHIQESLKQLLVLYSTGDNSKNRDEFESLYLLFNLNHFEALEHFIYLPKHIRAGRWCGVAWRYSLAVMEHNYVRAFRLLRHLEELQLYALHYHLHSLQCNLLRRMNTAYSSKTCKFPINTLCKLIGGLSKGEMSSLLTAHGLAVSEEFVSFSKSMWKS